MTKIVVFKQIRACQARHSVILTQDGSSFATKQKFCTETSAMKPPRQNLRDKTLRRSVTPKVQTSMPKGPRGNLHAVEFSGQSKFWRPYAETSQNGFSQIIGPCAGQVQARVGDVFGTGPRAVRDRFGRGSSRCGHRTKSFLKQGRG